MTILIFSGLKPSSDRGASSDTGALALGEALAAAAYCWNFLACSICICLFISSSFNSPKIAYEASRLRTSGSSITKMSPSLFFKVILVIPVNCFIPTFNNDFLHFFSFLLNVWASSPG